MCRKWKAAALLDKRSEPKRPHYPASVWAGSQFFSKPQTLSPPDDVAFSPLLVIMIARGVGENFRPLKMLLWKGLSHSFLPWPKWPKPLEAGQEEWKEGTDKSPDDLAYVPISLSSHLYPRWDTEGYGRKINELEFFTISQKSSYCSQSYSSIRRGSTISLCSLGLVREDSGRNSFAAPGHRPPCNSSRSSLRFDGVMWFVVTGI